MYNFNYVLLCLISTFILYFFIKNRYFIGKFLKVLDKPGKNKIHTTTTPLIGSFPLFCISILIIIYSYFSNIDHDLNFIFLTSYIFFLMGYIDDRYNLNAYLKLSISIIIYIFILSFSETLILKSIHIETLNISYTFDKIGKFFTILCLLLLINSLNLVDGINGLASCFVTLWMLCLALLSNGNTQILLFIFSILILINTYHIIKGKYFLGDSGSLFFGSLVGLLTIHTYNNLLLFNFSISVEKIFIFFMIPGIDMFRLFLFRIMIKKDPFSKDLNHMHHLILEYFSLKTTLAIYFILFFITNFLSFSNFLKPIIIIFIYLIIYVFFIFYTKEKFEKSPK
jgi:UDP-GlcNAc:undecaprenyl-phosphate/decaprenyl-phosphate GlcNAc-1-phosphate transferase